MYRKTALDALPSRLFDIKSYDWIVNICVARRSLIGFLEEPMSVYRLHAGGAWSQASNIDKLRLQLELIPAYSELTEDVFKADFDVLTSRLSQAITASHMRQCFKLAPPSVARVMHHILDLVPPILIIVVKWLVPPVMKRFLVQRLFGKRAP